MKKLLILAITCFCLLNINVVNAEYINSCAYLRDYDGNIIGIVDEGEYVDVYGTDSVNRERTIISYNGLIGTVLTSCIGEQDDQDNHSEDYEIEVSIANQIIYLCNNGAVVDSSPCVTGNFGTRDTPCGTFCITSKAENAYMSGDDYECVVDYWMAFCGGIGIHDAVWREDFGGDIYVGNGSHGCVNVPHDFAEMLYSICDVGTVVTVY